ncbi:lipoprotein [Spiroplasma sp. DGKH1]|uniref:lipoprotein n=1 Tax=Spiroplasma sp. DGKH1 TaxID=3050074 RepID=UPI0034C6993D
MKKLLSFLGVICLSSSVTTNIIACGGSHHSDVEKQQVNFEELLTKLQNQVVSSFGKTVNERKNLITASTLSNSEITGGNIVDIIKNTDVGKEVTDQKVKKTIFNNLNNIVQDISTTLIANKEFSVLFDNLPSKNILTLNTETSTLTKQNFDGQGIIDALGESGNDTLKEALKNINQDALKDVYHLEVKLNLKLSYQKEGKLETLDLSLNNFNLYIVYNIAALSQLITIASDNLSKFIANSIQEIDFTKLDAKQYQEFLKLDKASLTSDPNFLNTNVFNILKNTIFHDFKNLKINSYNTILNNEFGSNTLDDSSNYNLNNLSSLTTPELYSSLSNTLTKQETDFMNNLQSFLKNVPEGQQVLDANRIFGYGKFSLNNWQFKDLALEQVETNLIIKKTWTREKSWGYFAKVAADFLAQNFLGNKMFSFSTDQLIFNIKDDLLDKKSVYTELSNIKGKLTFNNLLSIYRNVFIHYESGVTLGSELIDFSEGGLMNLELPLPTVNNLAGPTFDDTNHLISYQLMYNKAAENLVFRINGYCLKLYPFIGNDPNQIKQISFMFAKENWSNMLVSNLQIATIEELIA